MKKESLFLSVFCLFLLTGCATYHISTESLVQQFANSNTEKKKVKIVIFPYYFFIDAVTGNDLREIRVEDKNGQEKTIPVTYRTGVRITTNDNSRTTFYFNTLLLKDSTITGGKTHFFNAHIKPINFKDISKIELQK